MVSKRDRRLRREACRPRVDELRRRPALRVFDFAAKRFRGARDAEAREVLAVRLGDPLARRAMDARLGVRWVDHDAVFRQTLRASHAAVRSHLATRNGGWDQLVAAEEHGVDGGER